MASKRTSLYLFAVWVLILAYETSGIRDCPLEESQWLPQCRTDDPVLPKSILSIECTSNVVTAMYTYSGSGLNDITDYGLSWICQSGKEVYHCNDPTVFTKPKGNFSINITEKGEPGSTCFIQGCVTFNSDSRRIRSNECMIGPTATTTTSVIKSTATMAAMTVTTNNQTSITVENKENNQGSIDKWIKKVLAPLLGTFIVLILLVLVVVITLVSVIQLRMRKYTRNWQVYGNSELPFDPHYTPVDIEKPSFNPTPRLSLLSVDMFQNLYMVRANNMMNGNLYVEQPSAHPNISHDQYDSYSSLSALDTEKESGNREISSVSPEVSIPHSCTSLDIEGETVGKPPYQSPRLSVQYIQHLPMEKLSREMQSLREDDDQDDLPTHLLSDLDYVDPVLIESNNSVVAHDVVEPPACIDDKGFVSDSSDDLHCLEYNSILLPSLSDPFLSPSAGLAETNVQLDKAYVSSESGYIQSHSTNFSTAEKFFIEEDASPDMPNQRTLGETVKQPAQILQIHQQSLESPTFLFDNERTKSMDSSLNCYDTGMDTQTGKFEEEVDILGLDELDMNYEEHRGYTDDEQYGITASGLLPYTVSDMDLDFAHDVKSGTVRPTSIDLRLVSDYNPSDLSSGYITTSTSCDENQHNNIMEVLYRQRLKDVKDDFIGFDIN